MKSRDPLIISIGWRKYQTVPVYVNEDENQRLRVVKYTPKFGACQAIIYGPTFIKNTTFVALQKYEENGQAVTHFRLCATGSVIDTDPKYNVMKKLKLVGTPFKINKNTAFIRGMFNSKLEVAKFQGAALRTVSGIRGQVKKGIKEGDQGSFRATFEDKIIKSDIVFLRTWYSIDLPKFYNPILIYGGHQRLLKTHQEARLD